MNESPRSLNLAGGATFAASLQHGWACPPHLVGDIAGAEGSQEVVKPDLTPTVSPLSACVYPLYTLPPESGTAEVLQDIEFPCCLSSRER